MTSSAVEEARTALSSPASEGGKGSVLEPVLEASSQELASVGHVDRMDTDAPAEGAIPAQPETQAKIAPPPISPPASAPANSEPPPVPEAPAPVSVKERPKGPVPTRSSIAQSSFAWMLEPDTTVSTTPLNRPASRGSPGRQNTQQHKKRHNPSREKNAFLFGEVTSSETDGGLSTDEIFGLQPIRKGA